ncbi:MAG: MBL fold metallo-hydrolase [Clostridia bacterium]|nr:MBL fold metallo-hydrolase [Clostridia bacterium]
MFFKRMLLLLLALVCLLSCMGCTADAPQNAAAPDVSQSQTHLAVLNVGKADCMLLFVQDKTYLIDTGWERTYGTLQEALRQYNVQKLDGVILTHCHKDHEGGLMRLAKSDMPVDAWYAPALYYDVKEGQHTLVLAAAQRNESVTWLQAGDEIRISDTAFFRVLGPLSVNTENENNNSLVLYVETPDGTLLLAADMKQEEENELLQAGVVPAANVLKVGHHGDSSASGDWFIRTVKPELAIISTSTKEEYDTPAASVLKRLGLHGATTVVTQDFTHGIYVTLHEGRAYYQNINWKVPDYSQGIRATLNVAEDLLTLRNSSSADIPLKGWTLYSSRGDTTIVLPDDAFIPANGVYKIGTHSTGVDASIRLSVNRLWHKSKFDQATLYDASGNVVLVTDNGMPE